MNGKENEIDLINSINNSRNTSELSESLKNFIEFMFKEKNISNLECQKINNNGKPDLFLKYGNSIKYLSIKKGNGNSVHQENLSDFIDFLNFHKVDKGVIDGITKFHFGDNSFDGTGSIRYSASECKSIYAKEINYVNDYIHKNKEVFEILLNRFLFKGKVQNGKLVDFIYHGDKNEGVWASTKEIAEYFHSKFFYKDGIHFGPLTYQVWGRNHKNTAIHDERRFVMQIKWGSITDDLTAIRMTKKRL